MTQPTTHTDPATSRFSPLVARYDGRGRATLEKPFEYRHPLVTIQVPAGFTTDFDSVPRLPLIYMLLKGRARRAAVPHDWGYHQQLGRVVIDAIMFDAMRDDGVPWYYRLPIFVGVRCFGWWAYWKHSRRCKK